MSPARKKNLCRLLAVILVWPVVFWGWKAILFPPSPPPPPPSGVAIHLGRAIAYVDSMMGLRPGTALIVTNQGKFQGMTEADLLGLLYVQAAGKAIREAGDRVSRGKSR